MGPSTCCLCAWHGVYQAAEKKKCIEPYLFMSRLNSGFTFHSRYQHQKKKKKNGKGEGGGYVRLTGLQLLFRMRL